MANKLVIMSIYTHNCESVMNLNNRMLNIDKKKNKKRKKQIKNRFFHKKPFFIEIKNQKIKNGFLYNTMCTYVVHIELSRGTMCTYIVHAFKNMYLLKRHFKCIPGVISINFRHYKCRQRFRVYKYLEKTLYFNKQTLA